jgi:hypothetical protein
MEFWRGGKEKRKSRAVLAEKAWKTNGGQEQGVDLHINWIEKKEGRLRVEKRRAGELRKMKCKNKEPGDLKNKKAKIHKYHASFLVAHGDNCHTGEGENLCCGGGEGCHGARCGCIFGEGAQYNIE